MKRRAQQQPPDLFPFMVAYVIVAIGTSLAEAQLSPAHATGVSGLVGLLAGIVWQSMYRRDLVDRLMGASLLFGVVVAAMLLPGARHDRVDTGFMACIGVVIGLALAEKVSRRRDAQTGVDSPVGVAQ